MPKIFEYFGLIFYFYSNEHEPIHVHVKHGDQESIFELILMNGELERIDVREKAGMEPLSGKDQRIVEEFIRKYNKNIIQKWVKIFVMKQTVKSTNITNNMLVGFTNFIIFLLFILITLLFLKIYIFYGSF